VNPYTQSAVKQRRLDRIDHIFKFFEYDVLTEAQLNLIISFEEQFKKRGDLSEDQYDILEDIFARAAERA
jgi:hypothetical protein